MQLNAVLLVSVKPEELFLPLIFVVMKDTIAV